MKPVNNKSMLAFIFDQMEKLDKKEISVEDAKAQANLAKQANNALRYEIDRSALLMKLDQHNALNTTKTKVELREAESKNFD
tara:strand:- start:149 stop:394 length:246 start_codon:yes stop_codon:yes gene_type:complete